MSESNEKVEPPKQSVFRRLIHNPIIVVLGIIGGLASTIALPLSVFFWIDSKEYPELLFTVHPVKAVLLQKSQTSKLQASFENKVIEGDITTAQVALWNNGKKAIKLESILNNEKSIQIIAENNIPILDATVRKNSRDDIRCVLNKDELEKGILRVSWQILELNDGCVIQLIYEGNPDIKISAFGAIEGQREIKNVQFIDGTIQTAPQQLEGFRNERIKVLRLIVLGLFVCTITFFVVLHTIFHKREFRGRVTGRVPDKKSLLKGFFSYWRGFRFPLQYSKAEVFFLIMVCITLMYLTGLGIYYYSLIYFPTTPPFVFD